MNTTDQIRDRLTALIAEAEQDRKALQSANSLVSVDKTLTAATVAYVELIDALQKSLHNLTDGSTD